MDISCQMSHTAEERGPAGYDVGQTQAGKLRRSSESLFKEDTKLFGRG